MPFNQNDAEPRRPLRTLQQQPRRESDPQQQRAGAADYQPRNWADADAAWLRPDAREFDLAGAGWRVAR